VRVHQPYYDFEIAKIIEWLRKHGYTMHVKLSGEVELRKKPDGPLAQW
jgi:hypothetical protein